MATKPTKHKQTNHKPKIFEREYFPFENKIGPGQIRNQDLCRPRRISYLQTKFAGHAYKLEIIMNQETK